MAQAHLRTPWLRRGAFGAVAATLLAVICAVALDQPTASTAQNPPIRAVYLPDPLAPTLPAPLARARGIQVVATVAELLDAAARADVDAVLLDRDAFDLVDPDWLAGQLRQGRAVVGFNVVPARLARLPGADRGLDSAQMRADWGDTPFYALAYQTEQDGRVRNAGLDADAIYAPIVFLDRLERKIAGIGRSRSVAAGPDAPAVATRPAR